MVKTGQEGDTRRLSYLADPLHGGDVEVITFARLKNMPAGSNAPPFQRADFHMLAILDSGECRVTVDFVEHRIKRGEVVWIRPGHVHCWNRVADLDGILALFRPESAPQHFERRTTVAAFADAVERHFATSRQVTWYAHRLGYSERTLSRATQEATGRTAKEFVDDRVILEAKRLLAHDGTTVAECARRTGFDDPANFSKFFRSRCGLPPGGFTADMAANATIDLGDNDCRDAGHAGTRPEH